jgi:hypothetical protein
VVLMHKSKPCVLKMALPEVGMSWRSTPGRKEHTIRRDVYLRSTHSNNRCLHSPVESRKEMKPVSSVPLDGGDRNRGQEWVEGRR